MLYLIGLGLDVKDISLKSIEILKKCKAVYLESYTIEFPYKTAEIEKIIKKKIILADRDTLETKVEGIIENAKKQDIAVLIYGDPLSATTHIDLLLRARKLKVKTKIIHNSSILTAIADTGLQLYKFGKVASIPKWQSSFKPESFYDIFKENQSIKAHTLFLLDIGLEVSEALYYFEEISLRRKEDLQTFTVIVCSRLGTDNQVIEKGKLSDLAKKKFKNPSCIIIPSQLHFMEAEMLQKS